MRETLLRKLKQLESISPSATAGPTSPKIASMATDYLDHPQSLSDTNARFYKRKASGDQGASNIAQVAAAIDSGDALDLDQIQTFERILKWEVDYLTADLNGKCTTGSNMYPANLTISNHYEYIVLPTLVYELEYPRSDTINWYYVAEKSAAVFGILMIMNMVSQTYIFPVVVRCNEMKDAGLTLQERLEVFPWILSDLIFPFMMEYMMVREPLS
jgi:sterol O-acyltransferase